MRRETLVIKRDANDNGDGRLSRENDFSGRQSKYYQVFFVTFIMT